MTVQVQENPSRAPLGSVLVVGGGISGMQSSLDLANAGFKVYLVERSPAIGGKMAQLDKTFPTNDCSMCIVSPKLVEVGRHLNIELLTNCEVTAVSGREGAFSVRLRRQARYVDEKTCTGCGLCEQACPVTCLSWFPPPPEPEQKKIKRPLKARDKTIIPASDSVRPASEAAWSFSVDRDRCSSCGACHRACLHGAIRWSKKEPASIDQTRCIGCGACYAVCPEKFSAVVIGGAPGLEQSLGAAIRARSASIIEARGSREPGDCIRCGLCVLMCSKVMEVGALKLVEEGIEAGRDICQACGSCVSVCPVGFLEVAALTDKPVRPLRNQFNQGLDGRKPVNILYPQAVPRVPVISGDSCVRLNTGACGTCASVCGVDAIDFGDTDRELALEVGSIIYSPGIEVFDARRRGEYGYGLYPNVVTSLEFERLLSASGPTSGTVARPGDGKHPRRVAWIQCVGSRDHSCNRDYCSSVCCMYATKEAVIAREHDSSIEPTIFYIDLRSYGKNFDRYVERARESGVRYVRAMVSRIFEDPQTGDLELRYVDEQGRKQSEIFELVVLSVGIEPPASARELAGILSIDLDEYGFAVTDPLRPLVSSRPGVYVGGACSGPKDIPETVCEASAAAEAASTALATVRGSLLSREEVPVERSSEPGEELRIGVFVCHCGSNIASVVDVAAVEADAASLPGVVYTGKPLYTCSQDSQESIKDIIREKGLNRVVVAACSPTTHEPLFMSTLQQSGLNKYLFDMANIRDHCSWVHPGEPEKATEKAKRLMRMAVAGVAEAEPLAELEFEVEPSLLIVGGGVAGMTAALAAAGQGFGVYLVEQQERLGGQLHYLKRSLDGLELAPFLEELREKIHSHERIRVFTRAMVVDQTGFIGSFESDIMLPSGGIRKVKHGAILIATGTMEHRPALHGLGEDSRVVTQTDLESILAEDPDRIARLSSLVMLQCAGSRCPEYLDYCSRVCCPQAVKNALLLKQRWPQLRIDVLYRDLRSYGMLEIDYRRARRLGVNFIRFDPEQSPPRVKTTPDQVEVLVRDPSIQSEILLHPDLLVLSTGLVAGDTEELASLLRVPRNEHGFFIEAHAKLRPVDLASEGVFLAGTAHGPKLLGETITQAQAAVARAATILAGGSLKLSGVYSVVEPRQCAVCLTCVRACPYGVPIINEEHTAYINPALCQGCGICVAECPAKAIRLGRFEDRNIEAKLKSCRRPDPVPVEGGS